jgi:hypothetical protein
MQRCVRPGTVVPHATDPGLSRLPNPIQTATPNRPGPLRSVPLPGSSSPPPNSQVWDDGQQAASKNGKYKGKSGTWNPIEGEGGAPKAAPPATPPSSSSGGNTHGCKFVQVECIEMIDARNGERCGPASSEVRYRNRCTFPISVMACFANPNGGPPDCGSGIVKPGAVDSAWACNTCTGGFGVAAVPADQDMQCVNERMASAHEVRCK